MIYVVPSLIIILRCKILFSQQFSSLLLHLRFRYCLASLRFAINIRTENYAQSLCKKKKRKTLAKRKEASNITFNFLADVEKIAIIGSRQISLKSDTGLTFTSFKKKKFQTYKSKSA